MCLSLPWCEKRRTCNSWFKSYSPRPKEEDPPSPMNWIGLETQKGWTLFWHLVDSRRSWIKRSSGQDKTGFNFCVHLQCTHISDFWKLYSLLKWTLKFSLLKVGVSANTFPQLYYCFPSPAHNCILAYNKKGGKKKENTHSKPFKMYVAKCKSLKQQQKQKCKGLKQICFQLRRSFISVRNPQQWDPSVQCLKKTVL